MLDIHPIQWTDAKNEEVIKKDLFFKWKIPLAPMLSHLEA